MTDRVTAPGPGLSDAIRFPGGTRLRVEVVLSAALREAIARASSNAALWMHSLDGATVSLEHPTDAACRLSCETGAGRAEFEALGMADGWHRMSGRVGVQGGVREFALERVRIQLGASCDAYLAQHTGDIARVLVRIRYGADGETAVVSIYGAALASRLTPVMRALLPDPIELLRLTLAPGGHA